MRKRLFYWELAGFLWTCAAGAALHFVYDWSGGNAVAAAFSAVNESVWEHMKLLFVPVFVFTVVQVCALGGTYANIPAVRALTALLGVAAIPMLYYTYTGALGVHLAWVDLGIFFLSAAGLFALDYLLIRRGALASPWAQVLGLVLLWAVLFLFVWCTFRPPHLPLWQDPITGGFGIPK